MKTYSDRLAEFLVALAGKDKHAIDATFVALHDCKDDGRPAGYALEDISELAIQATMIWRVTLPAEQAKQPSSVAWRLALTALEEGLERYLEDLHRRDEAHQAVGA